MYIGRTAAYYDCDDDYIFVPDLWDIEEDAEKLAGEVRELTEEGEELCYRYFHDLSCGYDLCHGRAKGLAAEYSREEFFAYVTDEKNGYIKEKNELRKRKAMKLKLKKAYRHSYAREFGSNDKDWYLDAYHVLVKVNKENPDWNPWEKVCSCTLHIHYNGHANKYGHHWSVNGFSDEMDRIMLEELGDTYKSYAAYEDMMKDLQKIVTRKNPVHYKYVNGKYVSIKYELA